MPNTRNPNAVRLEFASCSLLQNNGADLVGMAVVEGYLWAVASHGIKRKNAKPHRLVLDDAPGADRRDGEHTVFGDLLRHD